MFGGTMMIQPGFQYIGEHSTRAIVSVRKYGGA